MTKQLRFAWRQTVTGSGEKKRRVTERIRVKNTVRFNVCAIFEKVRWSTRVRQKNFFQLFACGHVCF